MVKTTPPSEGCFGGLPAIGDRERRPVVGHQQQAGIDAHRAVVVHHEPVVRHLPVLLRSDPIADPTAGQRLPDDSRPRWSGTDDCVLVDHDGQRAEWE